MRLRDLVGQDHAVGMLRRALDSSRVAHAYLFDGPSGVGKRSAAIGLALALACPREPGHGCGACDVCRRVLAGIHPDVISLGPDGTQIKIDQTRDLCVLAATRPHEAPARVVIVDPADALNDSASNSLLKTLEEPAPGTHFVLVTSAPDRLLATIRSRTQRVRFVPVPATVLAGLVEKRGIDAARAQTAAAMAGGSVARALELAAGEGQADLWRLFAGLRAAAAGQTIGPLFDAAAGVTGKDDKAGLPEILLLFALTYRDAVATAVGAADIVLLAERAHEVQALAAAAGSPGGLDRLRRAWAAAMEASTAVAANINAETAVERMLLELRPAEREAGAA